MEEVTNVLHNTFHLEFSLLVLKVCIKNISSEVNFID